MRKYIAYYSFYIASDMNDNIYGQFIYKNKHYTWHFIWQPFSVDVWNSSFKTVCRFNIELRLLHNKRALIEKCKEELEKDISKSSVDYDAYCDTANDIFET